MNKERLMALIAARQSKLDELQKRSDSSENVAELRSINTEMETINKEIDDFRSMVQEAQQAEELRSKQAQVLGTYGAKKDEGEIKRDQQVTDVEKRAAELVTTRKVSFDVDEVKRAITIGSGDLAQPKYVQSAINDKFGEVSSIIDMVKITPAAGMGEYDVPYVVTYATGGIKGENTDYATAEPTFKYASIKPVKITTYGEVSTEVTKLTNVAYLAKVREASLIALRKKIAKLIPLGNPSATPAEITGIVNGAAITASPIEVTAIDATTLRKIAMNYGGDENVVGNAVLLLNKTDLIAFGDVRGTNEKKAVYEITPDVSNPNSGTIKDGGLAVRYVINSALPALSAAATTDATKCMLYGVPAAYELALFSQYEIKVSEDAAFKKGMLAVRGDVLIGGNVVVQDGFVVVAKKVVGG
jgi:HK97 family phage major capsid protein